MTTIRSVGQDPTEPPKLPPARESEYEFRLVTIPPSTNWERFKHGVTRFCNSDFMVLATAVVVATVALALIFFLAANPKVWLIAIGVCLVALIVIGVSRLGRTPQRLEPIRDSETQEVRYVRRNNGSPKPISFPSSTEPGPQPPQPAPPSPAATTDMRSNSGSPKSPAVA